VAARITTVVMVLLVTMATTALRLTLASLALALARTLSSARLLLRVMLMVFAILPAELALTSHWLMALAAMTAISALKPTLASLARALASTPSSALLLTNATMLVFVILAPELAATLPSPMIPSAMMAISALKPTLASLVLALAPTL